MLAAPIYWCKMVSRTNVLGQYKGKLHVSRLLPIHLNIAYYFGWSERKQKYVQYKMRAK